MLEPQLRRVINVLILAAAALRKITAFRRDALRRRRDDAQQFRPCKILFDLRDFNFHRLAHNHERHEDDKIINPPDAFAAESKVVDDQGNLVADFERHAASLENKTRAKSLFA